MPTCQRVSGRPVLPPVSRDQICNTQLCWYEMLLIVLFGTKDADHAAVEEVRDRDLQGERGDQQKA